MILFQIIEWIKKYTLKDPRVKFPSISLQEYLGKGGIKNLKFNFQSQNNKQITVPISEISVWDNSLPAWSKIIPPVAQTDIPLYLYIYN